MGDILTITAPNGSSLSPRSIDSSLAVSSGGWQSGSAAVPRLACVRQFFSLTISGDKLNERLQSCGGAGEQERERRVLAGRFAVLQLSSVGMVSLAFLFCCCL